MIERAYHSELVAIYRQAAHIWRCAVTYRNPDASTQQRWYANAALEEARRVQTIVTIFIASPDSAKRWFAMTIANQWLDTAHMNMVAAAMQSVTIDDIAAVCNEIVPLDTASASAKE